MRRAIDLWVSFHVLPRARSGRIITLVTLLGVLVMTITCTPLAALRAPLNPLFVYMNPSPSLQVETWGGMRSDSRVCAQQ